MIVKDIKYQNRNINQPNMNTSVVSQEKHISDGQVCPFHQLFLHEQTTVHLNVSVRHTPALLHNAHVLS